MQGADGLAMTWMDARVDGVPVTHRAGEAVDINAQWINAPATIAELLERLGRDAAAVRSHERRARASFPRAFCSPGAAPTSLAIPRCGPTSSSPCRFASRRSPSVRW